MENLGKEEKEPQWITNKKVTWIDVRNPTREKMNKLEQHYSFHELNIEDSLSKMQIPKVDRYDDHVFAILSVKPLTEMFQLCKTDAKQRDLFMGNSPGYLLHSILDLLIDDLVHIQMKVEGNLDDIEDLVFDEKSAVAREISMLRREITTMRRIVYPLKRTILEISKEIQRFSEEDLMPYFDDVRDHIDKVLEALDESKETIEIFKDTDFMLSTEKSNKILGILTILFTLSIPASVIAAFYGMNVNVPGGIETGSPKFLGEYTSFIILLLAAIIPAGIMMYWFKKQGWLKV
jgi:magnesium transporter